MTNPTQAPAVADDVLKRIKFGADNAGCCLEADECRDLDADRVRLSQEIETLRRERDQWEEAYRKLGRNQYEQPWTVNEARRLKSELAAAQEQIAALRAARDAIEREYSKVSGDDGYNYAAGQEYGLRLALIKLDAALSTSPAGGGEPVAVQIKPLEWRGTEGVWAKADALFGATYRITEYAGMQKPFKLETVGFIGPSGHYELLSEAKAAAQADYEQRIRSTLATPQAPAPVEAGHWVTVRVEDTCDGLMINADDAKRWNLEADRHYPGHFLPDGRYRIALSAAPHLGVREG